MGLQVFWFIAIAVLWTGFFVLEGFDFGVGMLRGVIGRNEAERRVVIATIGPVWDGNEVWLIVAGAGIFAAFPSWYATMFSSLYLAMVLLLVALIVRGVSFEFRGKRAGAALEEELEPAANGGKLLGAVVDRHRARRSAPRSTDRRQRGVHRELLGSPQPVFRVRGL